MPNWCDNKLEIQGDADEIKQVILSLEGDGEFDFNKVIPYPEKFAQMDKEEKDSGYRAGGYKWCNENWGTKWNACQVIRLTSGFEFLTAWSPSVPVTQKLSEQYPNLTFIHRFEENNADYSGYVIFKAGVQLEGKGGDFDDYPLSDHSWARGDEADEEEGDNEGDEESVEK